MQTSQRLDRMFTAIREYAQAYQSYKACGVDRTLNSNDREWSGEGAWAVNHYFDVGEDALRLIVATLISTGRSFPKRILDFPSGSGRVTRYLRAFFPEAEIWASDIHQTHLTFCCDQFGVKTKASLEDFTKITFEAEFDLVFCGSLLTHLTQRDAEAALAMISRSLSPTGIAIVTFHGRHSSHVQRHKWKYVEDELFHIAEDRVGTSGFGFVGYQGDVRDQLSAQAAYGVSLIKPRWPIVQLEADSSIRILGYSERAWDDHQDVVIFGHPGVDE